MGETGVFMGKRLWAGVLSTMDFHFTLVAVEIDPALHFTIH